MEIMKFLGSSIITGAGCIQVVKDVADKLKVKRGDHIVFYEGEDKIIIKNY